MHDRLETVRCLWFLWCEDLTCDWLRHNKHSRHILGVQANIITAVNLVSSMPSTFLSSFLRKNGKIKISSTPPPPSPPEDLEMASETRV